MSINIKNTTYAPIFTYIKYVSILPLEQSLKKSDKIAQTCAIVSTKSILFNLLLFASFFFRFP